MSISPVQAMPPHATSITGATRTRGGRTGVATSEWCRLLSPLDSGNPTSWASRFAVGVGVVASRNDDARDERSHPASDETDSDNSAGQQQARSDQYRSSCVEYRCRVHTSTQDPTAKNESALLRNGVVLRRCHHIRFLRGDTSIPIPSEPSTPAPPGALLSSQ